MMHEKVLHFNKKMLMLHKKKVSFKKNRFLLHKKMFHVQNSYYFFPERRPIVNTSKKKLVINSDVENYIEFRSTLGLKHNYRSYKNNI